MPIRAPSPRGRRPPTGLFSVKTDTDPGQVNPAINISDDLEHLRPKVTAAISRFRPIILTAVSKGCFRGSQRPTLARFSAWP